MKQRLLFTLLIASSSALSQWSTDPNLNLAISDTSGSQELPKVAATSDGGCYISWFDTRAGAYRVYMQRLNAQGVGHSQGNKVHGPHQVS